MQSNTQQNHEDVKRKTFTYYGMHDLDYGKIRSLPSNLRIDIIASMDGPGTPFCTTVLLYVQTVRKPAPITFCVDLSRDTDVSTNIEIGYQGTPYFTVQTQRRPVVQQKYTLPARLSCFLLLIVLVFCFMSAVSHETGYRHTGPTKIRLGIKGFELGHEVKRGGVSQAKRKCICLPSNGVFDSNTIQQHR